MHMCAPTHTHTRYCYTTFSFVTTNRSMRRLWWDQQCHNSQQRKCWTIRSDESIRKFFIL